MRRWNFGVLGCSNNQIEQTAVVVFYSGASRNRQRSARGARHIVLYSLPGSLNFRIYIDRPDGRSIYWASPRKFMEFGQKTRWLRWAVDDEKIKATGCDCDLGWGEFEWRRATLEAENRSSLRVTRDITVTPPLFLSDGRRTCETEKPGGVESHLVAGG